MYDEIKEGFRIFESSVSLDKARKNINEITNELINIKISTSSILSDAHIIAK
jgi:hypothetical protein